jgi:hypothetical protein
MLRLRLFVTKRFHRIDPRGPWLECVLVNAVDHAILIARVERAACQEGRPLLYFASGYEHLR